MSLYKRGNWYWADFTVDGIRYRKSLETSNWQEAIKRQRELIEVAAKGQLETQRGPKRLFEAVESYLEYKAVVCAARTVELEGERLSIVKKHYRRCQTDKHHPSGCCKVSKNSARSWYCQSYNQYGCRSPETSAKTFWPVAKISRSREESARKPEADWSCLNTGRANSPFPDCR